MKRLILLSCLAANIAAGASADDYALIIPIETPGESAAWQIDLDGIYRVSVDPGLRDLAVFNADGQPVPVKVLPGESVDAYGQPMPTLMQAGSSNGSNVVQLRVVPVLPVPNRDRTQDPGDLQLIIDRDASGRLRHLEALSSNVPATDLEPREWWVDLQGFDKGIEALELDWNRDDQNVVARFEISASDNLQNWEIRTTDATVVLLEQGGARIERRNIKVASSLRYLRLRRLDSSPALTGLRANASSVNRNRQLASPRWIEARPVEKIGDLAASSTHHLYEISASVPASSVQIELVNDNAIAQLEVSTFPTWNRGQPQWTRRASVVAYRLLQDGQVIDNGEIPLSPGSQASRTSILRIDSTTPLASAPRLMVGYRPAHLLFLAEGRAPFVLAVGNATLKYPDYPVEAALVSLRARLGKGWQPPEARLDEKRSRPGTAVVQTTKSTDDWKRWMLWVVLILAATVVGGLSISLLRGAGQRSAEDRQQPPEE